MGWGLAFGVVPLPNWAQSQQILLRDLGPSFVSNLHNGVWVWSSVSGSRLCVKHGLSHE